MYFIWREHCDVSKHLQWGAFVLLMDTRKAHLIKKYIVEIFEKSSDHSTSVKWVWIDIWVVMSLVLSSSEKKKLLTALTAVDSFDSNSKLSTTLTAISCCWQLWQPLQAVDDSNSKLFTALIVFTSCWLHRRLELAFKSLNSCYKLFTPLTAFASYHWQP